MKIALRGTGMALVLLAGLATSAQAAPVTYCFSGAQFADGTAVQGCFQFDPSTGAYSNVALTTIAGSGLPGTSYVGAYGPDFFATFLPADVSHPYTQLTIGFAPSLGSSPGTASLNALVESSCDDPQSCGSGQLPARFGTGAVVLTVVRDPSYQMRYFSNLNIGDSVINLSNAGSTSTPSGIAGGQQNGNLCVNVYAYTPDEQLASCCSCYVTPNGLNTLSVKNDLAGNPLTPIVPSAVVVKLLASNGDAGPASCNAAIPGTQVDGLLAWGTTLHALPALPGQPAGYGLTETPFAVATLSAAELTRMTQLCAFIRANGSGYGVCKSCRVGGLGAQAR